MSEKIESLDGVSMLKIQGDPGKLAEHVIESILGETKPELEKALSDAIRLLDQAYQSILEETQERVSSDYNRVLDEIRSVEATLDKNIKLEASKKRSEAVNLVLNEVRRRLENLPEDERRNIYLNLARDFVERAGEGESYRILAKRGESGIISSVFGESLLRERLREKNLKIEIEEGLEDSLGGFKAIGGGGRVVFDYTLELVFENLKPRLSGTASRILFEE